MDIRKVKKLIEMLEESNLEEIEIQEGEESVRLVKNKANNLVSNHPIHSSPAQTVEVAAPSSDAPEIGKEEIQPELSGNQIKTPIVGTFYRRPNPEKAAFINVGDIIEVGDVVCIVEAMKMMNEIKSEYSGKVVSIIAEDGQPVEYGQSLFEISK